MSQARTIDTVPMSAESQPANIAELSEIIRASETVFPVGGGTQLHHGFPPNQTGHVVDLRQLNQLIDYPARDMTVTAQTGMTFATLQQTLATENQHLPIDVPEPDAMTLGGILATNVSGPRRYGYGTLRDFLIGVQFVSDTGVTVNAGGRVVKNVAGYDLMKLHIGALGTLGILTQVTFKVSPIPESQSIVSFGVNAAALGPTLDRMHASASRPIAIDLLNRATAQRLQLPAEEVWTIVVGFGEKSVTVDAQVQLLLDELATAPARDVTTFRNDECVPIWQGLSRLTIPTDMGLSVKLSMKPSQVATLARSLAESHTEALIHAHASNGILRIHWPEAELGATSLFLDNLPGDVHFMIERCPTEWKASLPIMGRVRGDMTIQRTIKQTLDPTNKFNPGRMFGTQV